MVEKQHSFILSQEISEVIAIPCNEIDEIISLNRQLMEQVSEKGLPLLLTFRGSIIEVTGMSFHDAQKDFFRGTRLVIFKGEPKRAFICRLVQGIQQGNIIETLHGSFLEYQETLYKIFLPSKVLAQ